MNHLAQKERAVRLPGRLSETVARTITAYRMFCPGDSVLVGVSGGPDSVALLYVLFVYAPKLSIRLGIVHLNHSLRGKESDRDAEFVASLAKKLDLPYYMDKKEVREYRHAHKLSLEEAAREIRYAFYDKVAQKNRFNKIALGHHADDNAELVLMHLFRGSGPLGISGIPPVREGRFVRPLIRLTRTEIIDFLTDNGLKYVSDSTNKDTTYLRNRIRHHLIPILKESYNPRITETLNRLSLIVKTEEEWIEADIIPALFKNCVTETKDAGLALSVPEMTHIHIAAQKRIIRKAIEQVRGDLRRVTYTHTEAALTLLQKGMADKTIDLPNHIRITRKGNTLCFSIAESSNHKTFNFEYCVLSPGTLFIKEIGVYLRSSETDMENMLKELNVKTLNGSDGPLISHFQLSPQTAFFDRDALCFPIMIRNFRPGDRFTPFGMTGTQKLKKYFINNKVPKEARAKCPILLCRGEIIWIAGHRRSDTAKITSSTQNVLKLEIRN